MVEIGTISKLLTKRLENFTKDTNDLLSCINERLSSAFEIVFEVSDRKIIWTDIESIVGTDKSVILSGKMQLVIGDSILIGGETIILDEVTVNKYNKFIKFAFPIIMIELATVEELVEHMTRLSAIGGVVDMTPENLVKVLDKATEDYEEKILNDPKRVDTITRPMDILGFSTDSLTDAQIRELTIYTAEYRDFVGLLN